jgi:hypothetical protein
MTGGGIAQRSDANSQIECRTCGPSLMAGSSPAMTIVLAHESVFPSTRMNQALKQGSQSAIWPNLTSSRFGGFQGCAERA